MIDDEHHEAYGAMIHRQLVEETKKASTRNYHRDQLDALQMAVKALRRIAESDDAWAPFAEQTLDNIAEKLS